jgi:pilus assembly protein Flp/PilA
VSSAISGEQSLRAQEGYSDRRRPSNAGSSRTHQPFNVSGDVMKNLFNRFVREEEGQDLIEYSLLAALIAVACIAAMKALAVDINQIFSKIGASLDAA